MSDVVERLKLSSAAVGVVTLPRDRLITLLDDAAAEILTHRARWSRLCALVMTDHRGDGLPTQEVTPDEMVAAVERVLARNASLVDAVAAERERCARVADEQQAMREELYRDTGAAINAHKAVQAEVIAAAIREGG